MLPTSIVCRCAVAMCRKLARRDASKRAIIRTAKFEGTRVLARRVFKPHPGPATPSLQPIEAKWVDVSGPVLDSSGKQPHIDLAMLHRASNLICQSA